MEIREVQVQDMMDAREARARRQRELLRQYDCTLICFTMNIAGPVKNSDLIRRAFLEGVELIRRQLKARRIPVLFQEESSAFTGNEAFFAVDEKAETVKRILCEAEEAHPLGRLFDIDILNAQGRKLEREEIGKAPRKCLLCSQPASVCGPRRIHTARQLQEAAGKMMGEYFASKFTDRISEYAVRALLYEAAVSPKPGLVDRFNQGSHRDMDFYSFLGSAAALGPHFRNMVKIGMDTAGDTPEETFYRLQYEGINAEDSMYRAAGKVNTHKGAVFSMGILCGAAGRLGALGKRLTAHAILQECASMTAKPMEEFFRSMDAGT